MKSIFLSILLSILCFAANAQSPLFYAYGNIQSRTLAAPGQYNITVSNFNGGYKEYPDSDYEALDIPNTPSDYVVWWEVGCTRFEVVSKVSSSPLVLRVSDPGGVLASTDVLNGRIAIGQEAKTSGRSVGVFFNIADGNAGSQAGLSPFGASCIQNYYKSQVDTLVRDGAREVLLSASALSGAAGVYKIGIDTVGVDTMYVSNNGTWRRFVAGGGSASVVTDATLDGDGSALLPLKIADQSATIGQVLKFNGTTWLPANDISGGGATIDSIRVTSGNSGLIVKVNTTSSPATEVTLNAIAQGGATDAQFMKWDNGTSTWLPGNEVDGSTTNELNTAFSIVSTNLRLTDAGGNLDVPVLSIAPVQSVTGSTGISTSNLGGAVTITNTAPDQVVAITESGLANVTGTYPNFNVDASLLTDGLSIIGTGIVGDELKIKDVATATSEQYLKADGGSGVVWGDLIVYANPPITGTGTTIDPLGIDTSVIATVYSVARPLNEVVYGTGSFISSDSLLKRNNSNGTTITTHLSRDYNPAVTQFVENLASQNWGTIRSMNMYNFAKRAVTDTRYGRFGNWNEYVSYGNSTNNTGSIPDTTGNIILNRGFNFQGVAGHNPKRPTVYESIEQGYRFPGENYNVWEWHIEAWDTLGRDYRPLSMAYGYDGNSGSISFAGDRFKYAKVPGDGGASQFWIDAQYKLGTVDHNYRFQNRIASKTSNYPLIEKYSSTSSVYKNILGVASNHRVSVGDSAGVSMTNRLFFNISNSATGAPEIISSAGDIWFDSTLITINSQHADGIQIGLKTPSTADIFYQHYNGNFYFLSKNNGNFPFWIHKNAPNYSFYMASNGKIGINNNGPGVGTLDLIQQSNDFLGGFGMRSTGNNYGVFYRDNSNNMFLTETADTRYKWGTGGEFQAYGKVTAGESAYTTSAGINYVLKLVSASNDFQVAPLGLNPEGVLVGDVGDIANNVGAGGGLYYKVSGTGTNTGWGKYMNLADANGASTNDMYSWNGSVWAPTSVDSLISEPAQQITYGTGSGIDSDTTLKVATNGGIVQWLSNNVSSALSIKYPDASSTPFNFFSLQPQNQINDPGIGVFNFWGTHFPNVNLPTSARGDHVWRFGYNTNSGGGRIISTDADLHIAFENNFYNTMLNGVRTRNYEFHIQSQDTTGVVHRMLTIQGAHNGTTGDMGLNSDGFYITKYNSPSADPWVQANRFLKSWAFRDSMPIFFDKNNKEGGGIFQQNAAGSGYLALMYADASNRIVNGGTGVTSVYMPAGKLDIAGTGDIYNTSGDIIHIGTSTDPTRLVVVAPSNTVLDLRNNLYPTRTWGHTVNSNNYALTTPMGNAVFEIYDNSPLVLMANDRVGIRGSAQATLTVTQPNTTSAGSGMQLRDESNNAYYWYLNSSQELVFYGSGNNVFLTQSGSLGLGLSPSYKLDVSGNMRLTTRTGTATAIAGWGSDNVSRDVTLGPGLSLSGGALYATSAINIYQNNHWITANRTLSGQNNTFGLTFDSLATFDLRTNTGTGKRDVISLIGASTGTSYWGTIRPSTNTEGYFETTGSVTDIINRNTSTSSYGTVQIDGANTSQPLVQIISEIGVGNRYSLNVAHDGLYINKLPNGNASTRLALVRDTVSNRIYETTIDTDATDEILTASNGLTKSGQNVKLGGALINNTTLTATPGDGTEFKVQSYFQTTFQSESNANSSFTRFRSLSTLGVLEAVSDLFPDNNSNFTVVPGQATMSSDSIGEIVSEYVNLSSRSTPYAVRLKPTGLFIDELPNGTASTRLVLLRDTVADRIYEVPASELIDLTASNGLTESPANNVILGGSLTGNTNVATNTRNLFLGDFAALSADYQSGNKEVGLLIDRDDDVVAMANFTSSIGSSLYLYRTTGLDLFSKVNNFGFGSYSISGVSHEGTVFSGSVNLTSGSGVRDFTQASNNVYLDTITQSATLRAGIMDVGIGNFRAAVGSSVMDRYFGVRQFVSGTNSYDNTPYTWMRVGYSDAATDTLGNRVSFYNKSYYFPNARPSYTSGVKQGIVWTGTGSDATVALENIHQTIANSSDATSHTVTLSNSGGTIQLVEGSNITLTTTGTSGAGIVTIASTGGGGESTTASTGLSLSTLDVRLGVAGTDTTSNAISDRRNINTSNGGIFQINMPAALVAGNTAPFQISTNSTVVNATSMAILGRMAIRQSSTATTLLTGNSDLLTLEGGSTVKIKHNSGTADEVDSLSQRKILTLQSEEGEIVIYVGSESGQTPNGTVAGPVGSLYINADEGGIPTIWIKMDLAGDESWVKVPHLGEALLRSTITVASGTTATFTGFNVPANVVATRIVIYKNGILLEEGGSNDYTISSNTPLTLSLATAAADDKYTAIIQ